MSRLLLNNPKANLHKIAITIIIIILFLVGCKTPYFDIPEGVEDPDPESDENTLISRLENPILTGKAPVGDLEFEFLDPTPPFFNKETYFYKSIEVYANHPVFSHGARYRSVWLEFRVGESFTSFISQPVSLPSDGSEVIFELKERGGPSGISYPALARIKIRLHPDVLVIPVHVHVFADPRGRLPHRNLSEDFVRSWFDPSPSVNIRSQSYLDPIEHKVKIQVWQGLLSDSDVLIDQIWTQADIQFHMQSYEEIRQRDGLDIDLVRESEGGDVCGRGGSEDYRLRRYYEDHHEDTPGLHLYLGGSLFSYDSFYTNGITCGPGCANLFRPPSFVAIDVIRMFSSFTSEEVRQIVIAHEFGHFLGLAHTDDNLSCGQPLVEGYPITDNLMNPSIGGRDLTPPQIERARQIAQEWLRVWE